MAFVSRAPFHIKLAMGILAGFWLGFDGSLWPGVSQLIVSACMDALLGQGPLPGEGLWTSHFPNEAADAAAWVEDEYECNAWEDVRGYSDAPSDAAGAADMSERSFWDSPPPSVAPFFAPAPAPPSFSFSLLTVSPAESRPMGGMGALALENAASVVQSDMITQASAVMIGHAYQAAAGRAGGYRPPRTPLLTAVVMLVSGTCLARVRGLRRGLF